MGKIKKNPIIEEGKTVGYEAPEKGIKILVCKKSEADPIIIANHYSHRVTKNSFLSFLVYYLGEVSGALQIGYGTNPRKKGEYNPDEVREFDRMWLSDEMPKFSETITISLLHHYLKKVHPEIKHLISYSDNSSDIGNEGTIYKAANYKMIGKAKSKFYILETGERVHPISMWHRHGTQKFAVLLEIYPNIKRADGYLIKYVYDL